MHTNRTPVRDLLTAGGWYVLWMLLSAPSLRMPQPVGAALVAGVSAFFIWVHVIHGRAPRLDRFGTRSRLRPIGPAMRWVVLAVPALVALEIAMLIGHAQLTAHGLLPFSGPSWELPPVVGPLLVVVMAPLLEEFTFRGWIQTPLERRVGPAAAIVITSALFALAHGLYWSMPNPFVFGLVAGYAVYATGSLWAGVVLHAGNNGIVELLSHVAPSLGAHPEQTSPYATISLLVVSSILLVAIMRRWRRAAPVELGPAV
jgi:membrane protease YdiL (CAAX protease family)